MYLHICVFLYSFICVSVSIYLFICVSVYQCICASMYLCNYLCICLTMYLCIYVSMCLCIYVSMYLCMYVSLYLCISAHMAENEWHLRINNLADSRSTLERKNTLENTSHTELGSFYFCLKNCFLGKKKHSISNKEWWFYKFN